MDLKLGAWGSALAMVQTGTVAKLLARIVRGMLESPIQALKTHLRAPHEREVVARLFGSEAPERHGP